MKASRLTLWLLLSAGCQTAATVSRHPGLLSDQTSHPVAPAARKARPTAASSPQQAVCGDAKIEHGETCDDGNATGGDGCSESCRREPQRFISQDFVLLADRSVVSTKTGQALSGRVTLFAADAALLQTSEGPRYFYGASVMFPPPSDAATVMVAQGCLLDDHRDVWCLGGALDSGWPPPFRPGPKVTEGGLELIWNRLQRAPGSVAGLAGNIEVGCILLDGAATVQCWGREPVAPYFSLSARMPLGRGRTAKQIVAGVGHFCVLSQNGEVGCWGDSTWGQTGYMAEIASVDRPELPSFVERRRRTPPSTFLKLDSPVRQLAASGYESCALLENGKLWCWGDTDALAFEDPNEPTFQERMETTRRYPSGAFYPKPLGASTLPHSPIKLPSACNVKDFSLLSGQLCVSCEGGCSKCWGGSVDAMDVQKAGPPDECLTF